LLALEFFSYSDCDEIVGIKKIRLDESKKIQEMSISYVNFHRPSVDEISRKLMMRYIRDYIQMLQPML